MPGLRVVVHAAGSVKHHLTDAAWDSGLLVSSAAAPNAVPVAEYTLAAILFANKQVLHTARVYRDLRTRPNVVTTFGDIGNYRRTVGVVGASRVGRRVLELLRPFDFRVLLYDPYVTDAKARELGAEPTDLDSLAAVCDVVTLHSPELP